MAISLLTSPLQCQAPKTKSTSTIVVERRNDVGAQPVEIVCCHTRILCEVCETAQSDDMFKDFPDRGEEAGANGTTATGGTATGGKPDNKSPLLKPSVKNGIPFLIPLSDL